MEPTTLRDLVNNHDHLQRVISNWDMESMLNLATKTHLLRHEVVSAFARKFGQKTFWLTWNESRKTVFVEDRRIVINSLRYCLPFLRIFGGEISKLVLSADYRFIRIDRYISQYCGSTLTHITFNYRSEFSDNDFSNTFDCVRTVSVIEFNLGSNLCCFAQWFPNVERLRIYNGSRDDRMIRVYFPYLKNLSVSFASCIPLLRANPQLQRLELNIQPFERLVKFLDIIKSNRSLIRLSVTLGTSVRMMTKGEINQLIKKHRLLVDLNLTQFEFGIDDAAMLMNGLNLLKIFQCQINKCHNLKFLLQKLDKGWKCKPIEQNSRVFLFER